MATTTKTTTMTTMATTTMTTTMTTMATTTMTTTTTTTATTTKYNMLHKQRAFLSFYYIYKYINLSGLKFFDSLAY